MLKTAFYIARRYIFARKSTNAINIISAISMLGIMVGSAALIIILSVFNGFEQLVVNMFNTFTPQVLIAPAQGKFFDPQVPALQALLKDRRVTTYTPVLEDKALLVYMDKQYAADVKGVGANYTRNRNLDKNILNGSFNSLQADTPAIVMGSALMAYLGVPGAVGEDRVTLYAPDRHLDNAGADALQNLNSAAIRVGGVFEVQQDVDNTALVPLAFMRRLLNEPKAVSGIEVQLAGGTKADDFITRAQAALGKGFLVKSAIQQHQTLYNMMRYEKWAVYIILSFILVIAIFNLLGSLIMLVIDKVKDIAVLTAMGAGKALIKWVFILEGMMIACGGCGLGLLLGGLFCLAQKRWGMIKMQEGFGGLDAGYPVRILWGDFLLVGLTVVTIAALAVWLSANLSVRRVNKLANDL